jgi:hypothetical protein
LPACLLQEWCIQRGLLAIDTRRENPDQAEDDPRPSVNGREGGQKTISIANGVMSKQGLEMNDYGIKLKIDSVFR